MFNAIQYERAVAAVATEAIAKLLQNGGTIPGEGEFAVIVHGATENNRPENGHIEVTLDCILVLPSPKSITALPEHLHFRVRVSATAEQVPCPDNPSDERIH